MENNKYTIIGTVEHFGDVQQVSDTFKKREFVIKVVENPKYPEYIKFELVQDKAEKIELNKGDEVNVHFNIKGRMWTGNDGVTKFFNSLQAWKVEMISEAKANNNPIEPQSQSEEPDDGNELPF